MNEQIKAVLEGTSNGCIICGDCLEIMAEMPDGCVDAIVTDPPYGLKFMGKHWDCSVPSVSQWEEAWRVLRPGGHLLSFFGTRTYHRGVVNIEDAGFEIRDQIAWLYGSGFPKSLDVGKAIDKAAGAAREVVGTKAGLPGYREGVTGAQGVATGDGLSNGSAKCNITAPATPEAKQWDGWGTALKPAMEPIVVARKPLASTVAANVLEHGTGGLNIDGCRIAANGDALSGGKISTKTEGRDRPRKHDQVKIKACRDRRDAATAKAERLGRWPANVIHDGSEEGVGLFPATSSGKMKAGTRRAAQEHPGSVCYGTYGGDATEVDTYADSGSAARFFYCAKASRTERSKGTTNNNHPTVKPLALMRYLCRLVTPPGGIVLDCFCGSGSTLIAGRDEGFKYIGLELDPEYCEIASQRIKALDTAVPVKEAKAGQLPLFVEKETSA